MQENPYNTVGNLPELPNAENFNKVLKRYLIKFGIVYTILICLISTIAVCITEPKWQFSQWLISLFLDTGALFDGKTISYGVFSIGMNLHGIIVACINGIGAFAFGMLTCGIITIGLIAGGVVAIGGNVVGIIAIGLNAVGVVAIGCNAVGIIAIGYNACGVYTFSYSQRSRGKYLFAPHRQDAKAVVFFTKWFPKLIKSPPTE